MMSLLAVMLVASACQSTPDYEIQSGPGVIGDGTVAPRATISGTTDTTLVPPTTTTTTTLPEVIVEPPSGEWRRTNPDLGGLLVITRDMIWDGEAFYILTRIGFGDVIVWRSPDGIEWTEHSQIGTSGTTDGPGELVAVAGQLIAAGYRDGVATVWIDEGTTPWREVEVGLGGIRSLVYFNGTFVALGTSAVQQFDRDPPQLSSHAVIWTSWDAETWTEAAGVEVFGEDSYAAGLVEGPAGLLTVVFEPTDGPLASVSAVVTSSNGVDWTANQPVGLDLSQVDGLAGGPDGYAVRGLGSPILRSADGINWNPLLFDPSPVPADGFPYPGRMALFQGQLVMAGGVFVDPQDSYNYMLPRVWIHLGQGQWADLGASEWFDNHGIAYEMVAGDDRLVVHGEGVIEGWGIFTFVPDTSD